MTDRSIPSNLVAEAMAAAHQYIFKMEWRDDETHKRAIEICGALTKAIHALPSETPAEPETTSVTLSAEEFLALSRKEKELTEALEHADAINSGSVNRICDLEHANRVLVARVDRLRNRIHSAYDVLAAASSEDAVTLPVKTTSPRDLEDGVDELDPPA